MVATTVKVPVYSADGTKQADIEVDASVFGDKILPKTMHQMVVGYQAHKRVGTHCAKTRGEVAGTNRKMYRQKGTGRARAGRTTSPLRVGGGVIFPPKPRKYDSGLPKKMRRVALDSALLSKFIDNEVIVVDGLSFETPKTKTVSTLLQKMGVAEKHVLIGTKELDRNLYMSTRNIEKVKLDEIRNFNSLDVLRHVRLVLTRDALDELIESRKKAAQARKTRTTDVGRAGKD